MSRRIFISAGHDNGDPGAIKYVCERDEVWDIANRIKKVINRDYSCEVYRDYWDWGWRQTVDNANKNKCEYFFELHENAGGGDGAECIIHNKDNQWMAEEIKKAFTEIGQQWRRTIIDPSYWVLKYTNMPAMIIECAFVDNKKDIAEWSTPEGRQKMAESLAKHIAKIAGLKKKVKPSGWEEYTKPAYKYKKDGEYLTGWQTIDNYKYYFKSDGEMLTGWQKINGKTYYFHPKGGNMETEWQTIDGKTYYFHKDGHMAVNETIDGIYYVDQNGVWQK